MSCPLDACTVFFSWSPKDADPFEHRKIYMLIIATQSVSAPAQYNCLLSHPGTKTSENTAYSKPLTYFDGSR